MSRVGLKQNHTNSLSAHTCCTQAHKSIFWRLTYTDSGLRDPSSQSVSVGVETRFTSNNPFRWEQLLLAGQKRQEVSGLMSEWASSSTEGLSHLSGALCQNQGVFTSPAPSLQHSGKKKGVRICWLQMNLFVLRRRGRVCDLWRELSGQSHRWRSEPLALCWRSSDSVFITPERGGRHQQSSAVSHSRAETLQSRLQDSFLCLWLRWCLCFHYQATQFRIRKAVRWFEKWPQNILKTFSWKPK